MSMDKEDNHRSVDEQVNQNDIEAAVRVFNFLEKNPALVLDEKYHPLRKTAGHVLLSAFDGKYKIKEKGKNKLTIEKERKKNFDKCLLRSRGMVEQRREAATKKGFKTLDESVQSLGDNDEHSKDQTSIVSHLHGLGAQELPPVAIPPKITAPEGLETKTTTFKAIKLCPICAELNWEKRLQVADMRGKVVLCTGSRVKIGHQCCLRLLKCGAFVIATTRFPNDAALRFMADPDFERFQFRLHIYGLDFRDIQAVQRFSDFITAKYPRLDAIVNNAAQTVRRPPLYYSHLMDCEEKSLRELPLQAQWLRMFDPRFEGQKPSQSPPIFKCNALPVSAILQVHATKVADSSSNTGHSSKSSSTDFWNHSVISVDGSIIHGNTHVLYSSVAPASAPTADEECQYRKESSDGSWSNEEQNAKDKMEADASACASAPSASDEKSMVKKEKVAGGWIVKKGWKYLIPEYQIVGNALVRYIPGEECAIQEEPNNQSVQSTMTASSSTSSSSSSSSSQSSSSVSLLVSSNNTSGVIAVPSSAPSSLPPEPHQSLLFQQGSMRKRSNFLAETSTQWGGEMMLSPDGTEIYHRKGLPQKESTNVRERQKIEEDADNSDEDDAGNEKTLDEKPEKRKREVFEEMKVEDNEKNKQNSNATDGEQTAKNESKRLIKPENMMDTSKSKKIENDLSSVQDFSSKVIELMNPIKPSKQFIFTGDDIDLLVGLIQSNEEKNADENEADQKMEADDVIVEEEKPCGVKQQTQICEQKEGEDDVQVEKGGIVDESAVDEYHKTDNASQPMESTEAAKSPATKKTPDSSFSASTMSTAEDKSLPFLHPLVSSKPIPQSSLESTSIEQKAKQSSSSSSFHNAEAIVGPDGATVDSAMLSQVGLLAADFSASDAEFPHGAVDLDNQQIDMRKHNSWVARLDEVSSVELVEVHCVNTFSPYILCSRLVAKMSEDQHCDHYIVNVSAMEGKFNRKYKSPYHPHTNMAKAALNMLTRTSAGELATKRIYMNSVDTGWITDEKPLEATIKAALKGFTTPIDEVDAMARILDPIFVGYNKHVNHFGKFFKDYKASEW
eukprot:MONOS_10166.1-p1 / transcript=MONOS_10166.1 / gene=MONOS_10166 / organism=Monocercomonoides_exilis_PA203 / gene_product=short chain dehydrogenase / transcript_product=short chain dehydrogenase / location=Mono_scaffold00450:37950-41322(-) / protein_length=1069 / sequence_SO=supercontig / SO=protein_coding / is_pseudo=false